MALLLIPTAFLLCATASSSSEESLAAPPLVAVEPSPPPSPAANGPRQPVFSEPFEHFTVTRDADPAPPRVDPRRGIVTVSFGSGWSVSQFGVGQTPQPLGATYTGGPIVGVNVTLHGRLGYRHGIFDVGLSAEGGSLLFGTGQLLALGDLGITTSGPSVQLSFRGGFGVHRVLYVGNTLATGGAAQPVDLPLAGAEMEMRVRDFTTRGRRPWFGFSLYGLFDLSRATRPLPGSSGGIFSSSPREPEALVGGVGAGIRFRVGFDVT